MRGLGLGKRRRRRLQVEQIQQINCGTTISCPYCGQEAKTEKGVLAIHSLSDERECPGCGKEVEV